MKTRCAWCPPDDPLYIQYHDKEWGVPVHDDRLLFEMLILEGAQAGPELADDSGPARDLSRKAFDGFNARKITRYDVKKAAALMKDPGIIRNRLKITATIDNARAFLAVQKEFGSFDKYIWSFVGGKTQRNPRGNQSAASGANAGGRGNEPRLEEARLSLRWPNDLLRFHAGRRPGQRSRRRIASVPKVASGPGQVLHQRKRPTRSVEVVAQDMSGQRRRALM